jgi:hypothetical protein
MASSGQKNGLVQIHLLFSGARLEFALNLCGISKGLQEVE